MLHVTQALTLAASCIILTHVKMTQDKDDINAPFNIIKKTKNKHLDRHLE